MRYSIYNKLQDKDSIVIYDSTSVDWSTFDWSQGYYKHVLTKTEVLKSYMISYAYYNSMEYDDIILMLNNIADIFEVEPGTEIYIPTLENLQNFILANQK